MLSENIHMIRGKRSFAVCLSFTVVVGQDILIAVTFFFTGNLRILISTFSICRVYFSYHVQVCFMIYLLERLNRYNLESWTVFHAHSGPNFPDMHNLFFPFPIQVLPPLFFVRDWNAASHSFWHSERTLGQALAVQQNNLLALCCNQVTSKSG